MYTHSTVFYQLIYNNLKDLNYFLQKSNVLSWLQNHKITGFNFIRFQSTAGYFFSPIPHTNLLKNAMHEQHFCIGGKAPL